MDRLPCIDKKFNVVIHIFKDTLGNPGITEATIISNFTVLNADFAPICVSFDICEFVYHDDFRYDNLHADLEWPEVPVVFNKDRRINVYYVDTIVFTNPKSVCGFATLGGIGLMTDGGVVISKKSICCSATSKTLSHEFGHYFGLFHTFEIDFGVELVNGSNCETAGDLICDTPADPFVEGDDPNQYVNPDVCQFISMKKDANDQFYDPLVGNIMSYYQEECSCGFTHQQYLKMANVYLSNSGMW